MANINSNLNEIKIKTNYTRQTVDSQIEKNIITGMIIDSKFLKEISSIIDDSLFQSSYSKKIANWCLQYFKEYEEAPGKTIQDIYYSKSEEELDEDESKLISKFLSNLSNEFTNSGYSFNRPYILDKAEKYFKKRSLQLFSQKLRNSILENDLEGAESVIGGYKRIERPRTSGVNLLTDKKAIIEACELEVESLFKFPGKLGEVIGPMSRGNFLGVFGPAGRGKTWWLQEIAIRALFANLKVLFVSLEMTQPEIIVRGYQYFLGDTTYPKTVRIPVFDCQKNQSGDCNLRMRESQVALHVKGSPIDYDRVPKEYVPCAKCREMKGSRSKQYQWTTFHRIIKKGGITWRKAVKKGRAIQKMVRGGKLHLVAFPAGSVNMNQIKTYIDNLESYENFIPDVIITDYADIMAPVTKYKEPRHQINETWLIHRGLAQERHCLVVTGSHTVKTTFERRIRQGDSSEEGRKLNHLTDAISLNQTPEEKDRGIMKIGSMKKRHDHFSIAKDVIVLQALDIGRPYLDSYI